MTKLQNRLEQLERERTRVQGEVEDCTANMLQEAKEAEQLRDEVSRMVLRYKLCS